MSDPTEYCADRGWACVPLLEATGNERVAAIGGWLSEKPLTLALIILVAWVANRILRRLIKRSGERMMVKADQIGEAIDREEEQPPAAEAAAPEVASPVTEFRAPEVAEQAIDKEPVQDMMSDEDDEPVQGPGRPKKKRRGKARCRPGSSERRWAALEMAQRNIRTP